MSDSEIAVPFTDEEIVTCRRYLFATNVIGNKVEGFFLRREFRFTNEQENGVILFYLRYGFPEDYRYIYGDSLIALFRRAFNTLSQVSEKDWLHTGF